MQVSEIQVLKNTETSVHVTFLLKYKATVLQSCKIRGFSFMALQTGM